MITTLSFSIYGIVDGNTMEDQASLGEYGVAEWKAKRHEYR